MSDSLTLKQVMKLSGFSRQTVLNHKNDGLLPCEPLAAKRFGLKFKRAAVLAWMREYVPEAVARRSLDLWTTAQVAEYIGKSESRVRQLVRQGELVPVKKLRRSRFARGTFEHFKDARRGFPRPPLVSDPCPACGENRAYGHCVCGAPVAKLPPVCREKCKTCPFRDGSPYAALAPALTESALTDASRICHSTGSNAINHKTGKPSRLCRGARDIQLRLFHAIGFLSAPTDAAWSAKLHSLSHEKGRRPSRT